MADRVHDLSWHLCQLLLDRDCLEQDRPKSRIRAGHLGDDLVEFLNFLESLIVETHVERDLPPLLLSVPLLSEVVNFLHVRIHLQLLLQLLDVFTELAENGDTELLVLRVFFHCLFHLLDDPTHIDLCDTADLDPRLRVEELWEVLQEE